MKKTAIIAAIAAMAVAGVAMADATAPTTAAAPKAPVATAPVTTTTTTTTTTAALTDTTVKAKLTGFDAKNPTWANTLKTELTGKGYKNVTVDAATGYVSFNTTDKNMDPCAAIKAVSPTYTCTK